MKIIVILGPTASGKSDLAVILAKKFSGEIISADSRQVYKGLDIGSGKITEKKMMGIPHHLLDIVSPKRKFTVAQFQKRARVAMQQIQKRGHLPFLVGGTGFYIQSVVDEMVIPEVKPNRKLRQELEKKSLQELFSILQKLDPTRAKTIDSKNPRRLIRALEIIITTKGPVPIHRRPTSGDFVRGRTSYNLLQIGIKKSPEALKQAIAKRLHKRLNRMIFEVKHLHQNGLTYKRLEELGLEYRYVAQYLQNKITRQEMIDKIQIESERFAKRQMTWFKRDKRIQWISAPQAAEKLIRLFLA